MSDSRSSIFVVLTSNRAGYILIAVLAAMLVLSLVAYRSQQALRAESPVSEPSMRPFVEATEGTVPVSDVDAP